MVIRIRKCDPGKGGGLKVRLDQPSRGIGLEAEEQLIVPKPRESVGHQGGSRRGRNAQGYTIVSDPQHLLKTKPHLECLSCLGDR